MSDPGFGQPVDRLDQVCKQYKDCNKCARLTFGETCIGEMIEYTFKIQPEGIRCKDNANSCERALCECDKRFALDHMAVKDQYSDQFHSFFSSHHGMDEW